MTGFRQRTPSVLEFREQMPRSDINQCLKVVRDLLPPPEAPVGLDRSWEEVESEFGLSFPSDYKSFIDTYGTGWVRGSGVDFAYLAVSNFRSRLPWIETGIGQAIHALKLSRDAGHDSPYPFFPEKGGLLPFAVTPNGDSLSWITNGSPDSWDVVFYCFDGGQQARLNKQGFCEVLKGLLKQESLLFPNEIPLECFAPPFRFIVCEH